MIQDILVYAKTLEDTSAHDEVHDEVEKNSRGRADLKAVKKTTHYNGKQTYYGKSSHTPRVASPRLQPFIKIYENSLFSGKIGKIKDIL